MYATQRKSDLIADVTAKALIVACAWNLNGVFVMVLSAERVVSLMLLAGSLYLLMNYHRFAWSPPFALLMATLVSYLIFGAFFFDPSSGSDLEHYVRTFFSSILLIWALTGYMVWKGSNGGLLPYMRFIRNCLVVSAMSIWASPYLYEFYVNLPPSAAQRMGGFFANPNEAGYISMLASVIVIGLPFKHRLVQLAALFLTFGAAVLTFSKTAMTITILLLVWQFSRWLKGTALIFVPIIACLAIAVVQDVDYVVDTITEQTYIELGGDQKRRIKAMGRILSAKFDNETSTGRSELWQIGIERALEQFPLGSGFGSFHFLTGGIKERGIWQGVHNTYIMLWGEAGLLTGLLIIATAMTLISYSTRSLFSEIALLSTFVLLIGLMVGHSSLGLRFHNLGLSLVFGLIALTAKARSMQRRRMLATATPRTTNTRLNTA